MSNSELRKGKKLEALEVQTAAFIDHLIRWAAMGMVLGMILGLAGVGLVVIVRAF
jgi:hypothetical protein